MNDEQETMFNDDKSSRNTTTQLLLRLGADPNDPDSTTFPIIIALERNNFDTAKLLTNNENIEINLNLKDPKYNYTPLQYMAVIGNAEAISFLLNHGAADHTIKTQDMTAYEFAKELTIQGKHDRTEVIKVFEKFFKENNIN